MFISESFYQFDIVNVNHTIPPVSLKSQKIGIIIGFFYSFNLFSRRYQKFNETILPTQLFNSNHIEEERVKKIENSANPAKINNLPKLTVVSTESKSQVEVVPQSNENPNLNFNHDNYVNEEDDIVIEIEEIPIDISNDNLKQSSSDFYNTPHISSLESRISKQVSNPMTRKSSTSIKISPEIIEFSDSFRKLQSPNQMPKRLEQLKNSFQHFTTPLKLPSLQNFLTESLPTSDLIPNDISKNCFKYCWSRY